MLREVELTVFAGGTKGSLRGIDSAKNYRLIYGSVWSFGRSTFEMKYQDAQRLAINPESFDLAILPWDIRYLSLIPSLILARRRRMRCVLWGHGYSKSPGRVRDTVRNACGKMADAVMVYSRSIASQLIANDGFSESRVFVAQNAIDQRPIDVARAHWSCDSRSLEDFQSKWNLDPACTVIFVSRLEPDNKVDLLINGLSTLRHTHNRAKLVIVGDGSDRRRLQRVVSRLGLDEHVIFTGSIYNEIELAPWMLSATLFCYPQNIGLSILHAFGYGLPVVTGDNIAGHNPEIDALQPDSNGLLFRDGDVHAMVSQWRRLMDDVSLRARLSVNAMTCVSESFTLSNMVNGFVGLIDAAREW